MRLQLLLCSCALVGWTAVLTSPANAVIYNFEIFLDGDQAGTSSSGTGMGTALYNDSSGLLSWDISWSGLTGNTTVAHFHGPADFGEGAGIQVTTAITSGSGTTAGESVGSSSITGTQASQLLDNMWYHNVHTSTNSGGEIRGQVLLLPEPTAVGILATGLLAMLGASRLRRRTK